MERWSWIRAVSRKRALWNFIRHLICSAKLSQRDFNAVVSHLVSLNRFQTLRQSSQAAATKRPVMMTMRVNSSLCPLVWWSTEMSSWIAPLRRFSRRINELLRSKVGAIERFHCAAHFQFCVQHFTRSLVGNCREAHREACWCDGHHLHMRHHLHFLIAQILLLFVILVDFFVVIFQKFIFNSG